MISGIFCCVILTIISMRSNKPLIILRRFTVALFSWKITAQNQALAHPARRCKVLDWRFLKQFLPGTFLLIIFTVSIYSCYLESREINRFQLFLYHNFSYTRILRNRIWSVASQRRSTWFEVLALLIAYRDQMFF